MISFLSAEGALTRSLMVAHAEQHVCRTDAKAASAEADTAIRRARSTDPATSHEAAANARLFAGSHCDRIVAALEALGSGTAQEIGRECGLSVEQCDRRLPELQRAGKARVLEGIDGKPLTRSGFRIWAGV